jgi:hypothetical protein
VPDKVSTAVAIAFLLSLPAGASAEPYIAGLTPWERPVGAPVIAEFIKDKAWYEQALTGVSQPYPQSLGFLDFQGAWFDPFQYPGMTGPYDIRGWHRPQDQSSSPN